MGKSSFKLYLTACGIKDNAQKCALLHHLGGSDVHDIFATMEDTGDDKDYFTPKKNVPYERHIFRQAVQEQGESVDSFVSRLKQLAVTCDFGDHKDDFIHDQVIDKCTSTALRIRLLREHTVCLWKATIKIQIVFIFTTKHKICTPTNVLSLWPCRTLRKNVHNCKRETVSLLWQRRTLCSSLPNQNRTESKPSDK